MKQIETLTISMKELKLEHIYKLNKKILVLIGIVSDEYPSHRTIAADNEEIDSKDEAKKTLKEIKDWFKQQEVTHSVVFIGVYEKATQKQRDVWIKKTSKMWMTEDMGQTTGIRDESIIDIIMKKA